MSFDLQQSLAFKELGMGLAADAAEEPLKKARSIAFQIARSGSRECDSDQVFKGLGEGFPTGPWAGSIFKGQDWEFTGKRIRSSRISNHAREIKIWKLR
jgi:hypothetical protein